jgi:hypothetical protein
VFEAKRGIVGSNDRFDRVDIVTDDIGGFLERQSMNDMFRKYI